MKGFLMDFTNIKTYQFGTPKQQEMYRIVSALNLDVLKHFNPIVVGTIPLDIDIETSDIDIIFELTDKTLFINRLETYFSQHIAFKLEVSNDIFCTFIVDGTKIEFYAQDEKTMLQNGYKHMVKEHQLLLQFGQEFKDEILALKNLGVKTEPAFVLLIGLFGNPYKSLLDDIPVREWSNPLKAISFYHEINKIVYLDKGWSHDLKFVASTDKKDYLIRITPLETKARKIEEFNQIKMLQSKRIRLASALEIQISNQVVSVYEWLEGCDLESIINDFDTLKQYELGRQVGLGLKDIQVNCPQFDWYASYNKKIKRNIDNYTHCDVKVEGSEKVIDFLRQHKIC